MIDLLDLARGVIVNEWEPKFGRCGHVHTPLELIGGARICLTDGLQVLDGASLEEVVAAGASNIVTLTSQPPPSPSPPRTRTGGGVRGGNRGQIVSSMTTTAAAIEFAAGSVPLVDRPPWEITVAEEPDTNGEEEEEERR